MAEEHAAVVDAVRRGSGRTPILVFANHAYLEVLLNWLAAVGRLGIDDYLIVALDERLHRFLHKRGIPVVLSPLAGNLAALWVRRIHVFRALCDAGVDFIHSDADAIWLRDPRADFFDGVQADLVASQGTVWPPKVVRQLGFVVCCGLFQLRSTPAAAALLDDVLADARQSGDDQVSMNRAIAKRIPAWSWPEGETYAMEFGGERYFAARCTTFGEGTDGFRAALLPHHLFQRLPMDGPEAPYVKHLLTPKESAGKMQDFADAGCLVLRPDWRRLTFDRHTLRRIAR